VEDPRRETHVEAGVMEETVMTEAEARSLPIHVETIRKTVERAWEMTLGTSTREDIDLRTAQLIGHLNVVAEECRTLDREKYPRIWLLLRAVDKHLAAGALPSSRAHAHDAYHFMRDTAVFTSSLLGVLTLAEEQR
jgi:hypothetical protein